jgi:serine O-acetyltransferase
MRCQRPAAVWGLQRRSLRITMSRIAIGQPFITQQGQVMAQFEVGEIVHALHGAREEWRAAQKRSSDPGGREFPSREALSAVVEGLKGALFPMRLGPPELRVESEDYYVAHTLDTALHALLEQARLELHYSSRHAPVAEAELAERATQAVQAFAQSLPQTRRLLDSDVLAAFQGDPAAGSVDEVLLCYPGVLSMIHHRMAHTLYRLGLPLLARIVAELAHGQTGIDIHPGAQIGAGFFIDHGTGVVIGETAVIGQRVRIYQAVTLGAKRFPTDADGFLQKGLPRHPQVEDDVVIYAGATILGRVTLGAGAVIGGNVWITESVPAGAHVSQATLQNTPVPSGVR